MIKNEPLVTIGIPTYNRANAYLRDALESVLNQTYGNIEIVVSDNCSTDHTDELVTGYKDDRIRYFKHDKNIGANNNFNFCLDKAEGKYFLLLHDDDMIDEDFIATCIGGLDRKSDVGIIRTGVRVINGEGNEISSSNNSVKAKDVESFIDQWFNQGKTSVYMCSALYNTKELQDMGGFQSPENLYQDVVAEIKLTANMGRLDLFPIKASFRRHDDNRGSNTTIYRWAVDSKYVIELINGYVDNKILIESVKFKLATWNYYRANRIDSIIDRLYSYFVNYKIFNFKVSPVFILKKDIKHLIKRVVQ